MLIKVVIKFTSRYSASYTPIESITFMPILKEIDELLDSSIAAQEFTGAVYLIAQNQDILAFAARGDLVVTPEKILTTTDTVFDLASLTKPLVTGMLLAQFLEEGLISLDKKISEIFPEFDIPEKQNLTIAQIASHSAGFRAWLPFYALLDKPSQVLSKIAQEPLVYEPGTKVVYSDLSYLTLGFLLEKISGEPLAKLLRQRILQPLNLKYTCFNPPIEWQKQIAASEEGNKYEKQLAGNLATDFPYWREEVIWGEVHDGNAYFLGGIAGHAGLFSTAKEVFLLAQQFLPGSLLLKDSTLELFSKNFTPSCEEGRSLCWLLAEFGVNAGNTLPKECFGHAGFTGTSLWIDPVRSRTYILLTNRTHPKYWDFNMNDRRREFHKLAQKLF